MSSYELTIQPERPTHNAVNGQFMKGHVPFNKGKKWSEWLSKRGQKRCAKGWKNLREYAPRSPYAGKNKKAVIAVTDAGEWFYFKSLAQAHEKTGFNRENIGRCCRYNEKAVSAKRGKRNTDHKYMGIRWYFETDNKWTTKIKQQ